MTKASRPAHPARVILTNVLLLISLKGKDEVERSHYSVTNGGN